MAEAFRKVARSYKHTSLLHAVVQITVVKSFMVDCTGVFVQVVHFVENTNSGAATFSTTTISITTFRLTISKT
jgi:hypothetical protein